MSKLFTGRRNVFGAGALTLLLVTATVVTAVRTDGYRASHVNLNDASVWISGDSIAQLDGDPQIGRVNTELDANNINFNVSVPGESTLFQEDDFTSYLSGSNIFVIDGATQADPTRVAVNSGSAMAVGGGTAAVLASNGDLWVMPIGSLRSYAKGSTAPAHVDSGSLLVVGVDGVAYTYKPGARKGYAVTASGKHRWSLAATAGKSSDTVSPDAATATDAVELTVVGSTPVVLDAKRHTIEVSGGTSQSVPGAVTLQQPGPAASSVVVATAKGLTSLPLHGGTTKALTPTGTHAHSQAPAGMSGAARPVISQGCIYGAWSSDAWEVRICPQQPQFGFSGQYSKAASTGADLIFRVNHDRVALNDRSNGDAWLLSKDGKSTLVSGWAQDSKKEIQPDSKPSQVNLPTPKRDCSKDKATDLKAKTVKIGARVGVPVKLSLAQIPNLPVGHCRVLRITAVKLQSVTDGSDVQVAGDGSAMQFTMRRAGEAQAEYTIDDGMSEHSSRAAISIDVHPMTQVGDTPPNANDGQRAPTFAIAGETVSYNALDAATDNEGDPMNLIDACVGADCLATTSAAERSAAGGAVQFQPDGWIRYTPPQTSKSTTQKLSFRITDQWGKPADGSVTVAIKDPKQATPVTHDDRARVVQGQTTNVDVLGNDVSPAGGKLTLASYSVDQSTLSAAAANAAITRGGDNGDELTVKPTAKVGTILVKYLASDGSPQQAEGYALITIARPDDQPTPVAMLDQAVARGQSQVLVDVTANDFDDAGNVLVVQSLSTEGGGEAQLMPDQHTVRVTPPVNFVAGQPPMIVSYQVSNGYRSSTGTLVVSPYASTEDGAPFTQPDGPVSIRSGMMTSIPVLANDVDPEGAPLRLESVTQPKAGEGHAFVEGDEVRYVADARADFAGVVQFAYSVTDAPQGVPGNVSSGQVQVLVSPANTPDQAPKQLALTARAVQGRTTHIVVPLLSADPDGDIVGIAGVSQAPTKGTVVTTGDGFDYTPSTGTNSVGTDEFTFQLTDGKLYAPSTVRVGVVGSIPSTGPVTTPIKVVVLPGQSRQVDLLDPSSVTSTAGKMHVQVTGHARPMLNTTGMGSIGVVSSQGLVTYSAPAQVGGKAKSVTLRYVVQDSGGSASNLVVITVDPHAPPQDPQPHDDFALPVRSGKRVTVDLLANDVDPSGGNASALRVALVGAPQSASIMHGKVSFTMPEKGVRFRYTVTSLVSHRSSQAIVSVPLNVGVICTPTTVTVHAKEHVTIDVLKRCEGPPGSTVHLSGVTADPSAGSASVKNQKVLLDVTNAAESGDYPLSSQVCVEASCTNTLTTVTDTLDLQGDDSPPSLAAQVKVPADGQAVVDLSEVVRDPSPGDQAKVKFSALDPPSRSGVSAKLVGTTLTINASFDSYSNGQKNSVPFTLHLDDTHGKSGQASGTVTATVVPTNDAPIEAVNDTEEVIQQVNPKATNFDVLANDVNLSKDGKKVPLQVASISGQPTGTAGSATVADGGSDVSFTPTKGFGGDTSFAYVARQKSDTSRNATATVSVHVVGFPGQPIAPIGDDNANNQVTLHWVPPSANGGVIDRYSVECQRDPNIGGGPCPTSSMTTPTPSITYMGLRNGIGYQFRARAHNEAGDGQAPGGGWSAWSATWTPDNLPRPPTVAAPVGLFDGSCNLDANCDAGGVDGGGGQLTVHWTDGENDGSPITRYSIYANRVLQKNIDPSSPDFATHRTTIKLPNAISQTITVTARNNDGESVQGLGVDGTPHRTPQNSPGDISVANGDSQLMLSWQDAPQTDEAPILGYFIQATAPGGTTYTSCPGSSTTWSMNCLHVGTSVPIPTTNGSNYTVKVQAVNSAGRGPESTGNGISAGTPGPVTGGTAAPGDRLVSLIVNPGNNNGSPISGYEVTDTSGNSYSVRSVSAGPRPVVELGSVNGSPIINGRSYGPFKVAECNTAPVPNKCSTPTQVGPAVTPFGPPTLSAGQTQSNKTSVRWTWTPQDGVAYSSTCSNGGAPTQTPGAVICEFGPGPARPIVSVTVTATSQNAPPQASTGNGSTKDTRSVATGWGSIATGYTTVTNEACDNCYWVNATLSGFLPGPNSTYTITWYSDLQYRAGSPIAWYIGDYNCVSKSSGNCYTTTVTPDRNGNVQIVDGQVTVGTGVSQTPAGRWSFASAKTSTGGSVSNGFEVDGLTAKN